MTRRSSCVIGAATLCVALCASLGSAQEPTPATRTLSQEQLLRIATEVRGQMVALPQYGVFDNIHFWGQPRRHSCAPRGSTLRRHLQFTSAYRNTPLITDCVHAIRRPSCGRDHQRSSIGYHAIHIIVRNGNVNLTGVVNNESDMAIAGIRASGVPQVFSVDNPLQVATR